MLVKFLWLLVGLTIGYAWGRQQGMAEGELRGKSLAPLELAASGLQSARCPVCGRELPVSEESTSKSE